MQTSERQNSRTSSIPSQEQSVAVRHHRTTVTCAHDLDSPTTTTTALPPAPSASSIALQPQDSPIEALYRQRSFIAVASRANTSALLRHTPVDATASAVVELDLLEAVESRDRKMRVPQVLNNLSMAAAVLSMLTNVSSTESGYSRLHLDLNHPTV